MELTHEKAREMNAAAEVKAEEKVGRWFGLDEQQEPAPQQVAPEQPVVVVEIVDNGPGIDEASRDKIFEPFYTTKEGRGGTGLGLSVSHGIIKEHDGWIEVDAGAGGVGTAFRVCLPAALEPG